VSDSELVKEALRINERYLAEIVEEFDLCPWARGVRNTPKLRRKVFLSAEDSPALRQEVANEVEGFAAHTEAEIGLLIFPKLVCDAGSFRAFVASLEAAHAAEHPRHDIPLAMAAFHPRAEADLSSPARLVSFIRRSPDPTIQLVRRDAMAKVRQGEGGGSTFAESLDAFMPLMGKKAKVSVSDNIAKTNLRTVERVGVEVIEKLLEDIAKDRRKSYELASSA
jgi:hypothetical protein